MSIAAMRERTPVACLTEAASTEEAQFEIAIASRR